MTQQAIQEEPNTLPPTLDQIRAAHDDKGHSEEMCTRCGWTMGNPRPLNCANDNTPHVFPSTLAIMHASERLAYALERAVEDLNVASGNGQSLAGYLLEASDWWEQVQLAVGRTPS